MSERIAVLGLGRMGHGIAQAFAMGGHTVCGYDAFEESRQNLHDRIRTNLQQFAAAGIVTEDDIDPVLSRISTAGSQAEAVADANYVVEAVAEDLDVKKPLLKELETQISDDCIIMSNSSTFPVSASGADMASTRRFIITHWFNPPHIVPTVEIVPGPETDPDVTEKVLALHRDMGKQAVLIKKEIDGFLVNRMQMALIREVWDMLDQGIASPEDIDAAVRGSLGFRLAMFGPLAVCDYGGLDIWNIIYKKLTPQMRSDCEVPPVIDDLVKAGHFGTSTGKGIYDHSDGAGISPEERDQRMIALLNLVQSFENR